MSTEKPIGRSAFLRAEAFKKIPPSQRNDYFAEAAREYRLRQEVDIRPSVELIRGSSITPAPHKWLWKHWLAAGKAHVFGGAPGCGKTTIALDFAATISRGGAWPDGSFAPVGNTIIWSGEDDPTDTLVPRLLAANADMGRILFVGDVRETGKARSFDPSKDIEPLKVAIEKAGGASLLIVDPLVSAISGDSHKNAEVRKSLQPLVDLATNVGAALLGITHFSKGSSGRDPTERITGSLAFGALARIVLVAAKIPAEEESEQPSRVFMRSKSNIGPDDGGFEYELRHADLDHFEGVSASHVQWGAQIEGSARDVLNEAEASNHKAGGAVEAAATFMHALLCDGPLAVKEIRSQAEAAGFSWAAIRRAQKILGITSKRQGYGETGWFEWSLPSL